MNVYQIKNFKDNQHAKLKKIRKTINLIFLAYVLFYFATYMEDYSQTSLTRAVSYIKIANQSTDAMGNIDFRLTQTSKIDLFASGIVTCDKDYITFYNAGGQIDKELALVYTLADMAVGSNQVVAFNRGGVDYSVSNSFGELYKGTTASEIIDVSISEDDSYIITTDEIGYISAITMFDKDSNEVFKWSTNYNIVKAISKENKIASICVSQDGVQFSSILKIFDSKTKKEEMEVDLGNRFPLDITFLSNDNIVIIFNEGIIVLDSNGDILYSISQVDIKAYNIEHSHNIIYAIENADLSTTITIIGNRGNKIAEKTLDYEIDGYQVDDNNIYCLTGDFVIKYDLDLIEISKTAVDNGIKSIKLHSNGCLYGVYNSKLVQIF